MWNLTLGFVLSLGSMYVIIHTTTPQKQNKEIYDRVKTRKIISFIFSLVNKFSWLLVFTTWGYRNVLLAKRSHTVLPDDSWSVSCALVR